VIEVDKMNRCAPSMPSSIDSSESRREMERPKYTELILTRDAGIAESAATRNYSRVRTES